VELLKIIVKLFVNQLIVCINHFSNKYPPKFNLLGEQGLILILYLIKMQEKNVIIPTPIVKSSINYDFDLYKLMN